MGGTVGVALFTGVMISRFRDGVAEVASDAPLVVANADSLLNRQGVEVLERTYAASAAPGAPAFDTVLGLARVELADAIGTVFGIAAVVAALAWLVVWWLPELELARVSPAEQMRKMREQASAGADASGVPSAEGRAPQVGEPGAS